jgi:RimJ/RimL family protein N-acetyltransferase
LSGRRPRAAGEGLAAARSQPSIHLRPAKARDCAALADLHLRSARRGFAHIFPSDRTQDERDLVTGWLAQVQSDPALDRLVIVAELGNEIVGVLVAGRDPADPAVGRLGRTYIDPGLWDLGIGRRLFDAGIGHLRELGCTLVVGWVLELNYRSRAALEHLGMTCTGERQPTCEGAASAPADAMDVRYELPLGPPDTDLAS